MNLTREQVIKALRICAERTFEECDDCPCSDVCLSVGGKYGINKVAADMLEQSIQVVRCKDCKWCGGIPVFLGYEVCMRTESIVRPDNFCSYGNRMDGGADV